MLHPVSSRDTAFEVEIEYPLVLFDVTLQGQPYGNMLCGYLAMQTSKSLPVDVEGRAFKQKNYSTGG